MTNKNYQDDFNQNRSQRRKKTTGVVALGLAGVLVLGSLFAFFSDKLLGSGKAVAGTINLEPLDTLVEFEEGYILNLWRDTGDGIIDSFELEPYIQYDQLNAPYGVVLNPGDKLVITGDVKNTGSKSAWLYSELRLSLLPADIVSKNEPVDTYPDFQSMFRISSVTPYGAVEEIQTPLDQPYGKLLGVISGTVENSEETPIIPGIEWLNTTDYMQAMYVIEFLGQEATNAAQGLTINIDVEWKAIQYRNNNVADESLLMWQEVQNQIVSVNPVATP